MKTGAGVEGTLRKVETGAPGIGTTVAKRGVGGRIGAGALGVLILLFGLILVGAGYEEGPGKVADGTPGTITIERCGQDHARADTECSGAFRSDDGGLRYIVEDFEPGTEYDKGERVDAVALSPQSFDRGVPALYVEGARYWCIALAMFGVAVFLLSSAFRSGKRPMQRGMTVTSVSLLFGGLLGCGLCVLTNSILA